jgi:hypothetical protein
MLPALPRAGQRAAFPRLEPEQGVGGNLRNRAMTGRMDTPDGNLAPQRGWWSRNWKWVVPVGCLGMLASCGCLVAVIVGVVFGAIKNTGAYTEAVALAMSDSEVQAVLGTKIETGFPQGSVNSNNGHSTADISISLDGDKADGVLRVEAVNNGGGWNYSVLQVEVPGRQPIDLRDKVGGGIREDLAPPNPDAPDAPPLPDTPPTPDTDGDEPPEPEDAEQPQDGDTDIKL